VFFKSIIYAHYLGTIKAFSRVLRILPASIKILYFLLERIMHLFLSISVE